MQKKTPVFVDTELFTIHGLFNIRVYRDSPNKETVVLWTKNLDYSKPVLTRVHSECFTGDVLGSCKCDCGKQLKKSLEAIQKQGGVLIYLRQEGRGIGLFEKIKAYQLQSTGIDTFEANVALGHAPDARTYEMVKVALEDLEIDQIKLLTNNPSKVSEIAKFGIYISERVPLKFKPGEHNRSYLESKRDKFSHFLDKFEEPYFYKIQVESASQVKEIAEFLNGKFSDPLLRIGIGISAKVESLSDPEEIVRIRSIQKACISFPKFESILHFSYEDIDAFENTFEDIAKHFGEFDRLQLNDLPSIQGSYIKKAAQLFSIDLPVCPNQVATLVEPDLKNILLSCRVNIVIDQSKGKGISTSFQAFQSSIDQLIKNGIHDITLCGGFGPDKLETYFRLRRFYKINFSVDAETFLKENSQFSLSKIKLYLAQLFKFYDPNEGGIEQTREFQKKSKTTKKSSLNFQGHSYEIHPGVFNANAFPSTTWFANEISSITSNSTSFCEVGCGAGVISCSVAVKNKNIQVFSTDIDPRATKNTKENAKKLGVSQRVHVACGDVLDPIDPNLVFDVIFWALPFGYMDPGANITIEEMQVFDPGYKSIRKFLKSAPDYLKPGGKILLGFSSDLGHLELLNDLAIEQSMTLRQVQSTVMQEKNSVQFEILECVPSPHIYNIKRKSSSLQKKAGLSKMLRKNRG